jgi:hypothetical protein
MAETTPAAEARQDAKIEDGLGALGPDGLPDTVSEDDRALAALGYTPVSIFAHVLGQLFNSLNMVGLTLESPSFKVFKREFSLWSCFSFAMSISGLYATIMATFIYPLYAGGAASVVWCWLIGGGGALALALSIAEISSAYPTSGENVFLTPGTGARLTSQVPCILLSSTWRPITTELLSHG